MNLIKPKKLEKGDKVATITLSWGGPAIFPDRYKAGVKQLQETFGVEVVEMPHTLSPADWIEDNPKARADDFMKAFKDPEIKAIISTIGGEDTIRILPFIDFTVIKNNPKIFLGYSDTTVNHFMCLKAGLSSFYGPSIMSGFAENGGMHNFLKDSIWHTLFSDSIIGEIKPSLEGWTDEMLDWGEPSNQNIKRQMKPSKWKFLQGKGVTEGHLFGGCLESLNLVLDSELCPSLSDFDGAILFLESCEDDTFPDILSQTLQKYKDMGILDRISGIIFGRPYSVTNFDDYDNLIVKILASYNKSDLPVITQMDFGHTDPMFVIPYGAKARIDSDNKTFAITDSAVI